MTPPGPAGPDQPPVPARRQRGAHARARHRARTPGTSRPGARAVSTGAAALVSLAVVVGAAAVPVAVARGHAPAPVRPRPAPVHHRHHQAVAASGALCPLTGAPAPGGTVPARPALAVKVDNYPTARPQSALDQADIVFEEPVEGFITRLVAVFQCSSPPLIGPVRSARQPDVGIADLLSHPLLVHAGGINPILAMLNAANLTNVDLVFRYSDLPVHPPGRYPPYDTYVSAQQMWRLAPSDTSPPAAVFTYSRAVPSGAAPTATVHIPFSGTSNATWAWVGADRQWQLSYSGTPATTLSGPTIDGAAAPIRVANVVAMHVLTHLGPYVEDAAGAHDVYVTATGSGPVTVFRDGVAISGTWHRRSLSSPLRLLDKAGETIPLAPGETWVELVPSVIPITTTAPATSGSGSAGTTAAG